MWPPENDCSRRYNSWVLYFLTLVILLSKKATEQPWREVNNRYNSDCVGLCRPLLITTKDFGLLWQSPHLWGRRSLSGGDERDSFQLRRYKKKALIYYFIRNGSVKKKHTHTHTGWLVKGFSPIMMCIVWSYDTIPLSAPDYCSLFKSVFRYVKSGSESLPGLGDLMNSPLQSRPLPSLPQPVRAYLPVIHDQKVSSYPNFRYS